MRKLAILAVFIAAVLAAAAWGVVNSASERWLNPMPGSVVTIPRGKTVVLDVQPPRLKALRIDGRLIIADKDVMIEAQRITVRGRLEAGSARRPFTHHLTIILDSDGEHGGALTALNGGTIALWGTAHTSWTRLAATAQAGARTVQLSDAVDWSRGDRIVIAPTGFDAMQAEERSVEETAGTQITLDAPLHYRHWGIATDGAGERAEVGLLTHSILVQTNRESRPGVGGQVLILAGGTLHASGVEFSGLGEEGVKAHYAVHFHLAGDGRGSFVRDSSVVHSNNRCIVLHGTSGVTVSNNVAYDAIGHCYFFEDGIEHDIVLEHNLGILTRAAAPNRAILDSDVIPATFWITNPANTVLGNAAAGSQGNGFWYDLSPHPTGPSATPNVWPRRTALGEFDQNVSHSNEYNGLFVDILRNPPGVREAPNYDPPVTANFTRFLSYKNRRRGVWLRGTHLELTDSVIADNSIGVTFAGAADELANALVIGQTANDTGPPKPFDAHFPIRGFEFYDGRVDVRDTTFQNFVSDSTRRASALSVLEFSPFFMDPTNFAQRLTFRNAERVYLAPHVGARDKLGGDGYRSAVFRDLDGSVTGSQNTSVVYDTPFLDDADCKSRPQWNARVCDSDYASLFVVVPGIRAGAVRVAQIHRYAYVTLYGNPDRAGSVMYQTNVRANGEYAITVPRGATGPIRLAAHHLSAGETVTVDIAGSKHVLHDAQVVLIGKSGSVKTKEY